MKEDIKYHGHSLVWSETEEEWQVTTSFKDSSDDSWDLQLSVVFTEEDETDEEHLGFYATVYLFCADGEVTQLGWGGGQTAEEALAGALARTRKLFGAMDERLTLWESK